MLLVNADICIALVFPAVSSLRAHLALLKRVSYSVILPNDDLPLLLCCHMLNPHLLGVFFVELADKPWVPKLTCDTQIFTAAHQSVGFTSFSRSRDAIGLEVLLLAARDRDKAVRKVSIAE